MKELTFEQKKKRAIYQKKYRQEHPEYVAAYRKSGKVHQKRWNQTSAENRKRAIIRDYIRQGMLVEGWKIEITHVYKGKIQQLQKMVTEEDMFDSHNQVLKFTFERMLKELGYD